MAIFPRPSVNAVSTTDSSIKLLYSSRRQILAQTSRTKDLPRKRGHKSRPEGLGVHHSPDNFFSLVAEAIKAEDGPGKYAFSARGSFISSVEVFDKYWP